uniref:Uncharacterized protein n=1 Tax=Arundo donax TaxID=35708 RepID=A0A0A8YQF1_ARUDO
MPTLINKRENLLLSRHIGGKVPCRSDY